MWFSLYMLFQLSGTSLQQDEIRFQFSPPVRVESSGKPIDVTVGHAAPYLHDFDGDGLKDLLVGEFGDVPFPNDRLPSSYRSSEGESSGYSQGRLRIYKNYGSAKKPIYRDFYYLKAGDEFSSIPST